MGAVNTGRKQHRIVKMALSHIISKIRLEPRVLHCGYCACVGTGTGENKLKKLKSIMYLYFSCTITI